MRKGAVTREQDKGRRELWKELLSEREDLLAEAGGGGCAAGSGRGDRGSLGEKGRERRHGYLGMDPLEEHKREQPGRGRQAMIA